MNFTNSLLWSILLYLSLSFQALAGWPDNRIVRFSDGGSGSFIQIGDATVILSCAHRTIDTSVQVGEKIPYECGDDSRGVGTVLAVYPLSFDSKPFRDAAIYTIDRPPPAGMKPFRITNQATSPNTKVWVVGFPGPSCNFNSRTTTVRGYDGSLLLNGLSIPGESGGPIVNEQGEIVGTLSGVMDGSYTYACPAITIGDLCKEVETTWCPNGRCPPIYRPVQPAPTPKPVPAPKPAPVPPQPAFDWDEYDKRQLKLLEAIKANKCDCAPTNLTEVNTKLNLLLQKVDAISQQKPPQLPAPEHKEHVVIVADHNAPYWERLAVAIQNCKKTYSGIREIGLPPFEIGTHPKAVVYRDSVPIRIVEGQYNVEALLSRLSRGEPI